MTGPSPSARDVRMRGFTQRAPVEAVWQWLEQVAPPLAEEWVALDDAPGRVLTRAVTAPEPVPPFPRSAMDGYALRGEETVGAGDYNPLAFSLAGEALPGKAFEGTVAPGAAVRIMTGAPVPDGADAVVPVEYAREGSTGVEVTAAVPPRKNVGPLGEDVAAGEVLLEPGRRLRPQDVGLAASLGRDRLAVVRRPRARLLVTGNELAPPGGERGPAQIYDANSAMLRGLAARDGGVLAGVHRVADDPRAIGDLLGEPGADVVIVTGGSSVGAEDHAPHLVATLGELAFHGVAMRPSAPTGMGRVGDRLVFLLPGNPVSCLAAWDLFAGRALRTLGGRPADLPHRTVTGPLAGKIASAIGRVDYCRVALGSDGVTPIALSGASILSSTTRADGFVLVPADSEGYGVGSEVTVRLYDASG